MNLHNMVRGAISTVNPDILVSLKKATGYTTLPNGKQVPGYAAPVNGPGQVQALDPGTQKHLNNLNISGIMRRVYLYGNWMGVVRGDKTGGDMVSFPQVPGGAQEEWKVVHVIETWPDWCSVAVVLQVSP